jgi:hypothetical protein
MDREARDVVRLRANGRCEYCDLRQSRTPLLTFHIEHIQARQHRGDDSVDNACLACPSCNFKKGPNQSAFDPQTGLLVRLFHPRKDVWSEHFRDEDGQVIGRTAEGRATVALLEMNRPELVRMRQIADEQED